MQLGRFKDRQLWGQVSQGSQSTLLKDTVHVGLHASKPAQEPNYEERRLGIEDSDQPRGRPESDHARKLIFQLQPPYVWAWKRGRLQHQNACPQIFHRFHHGLCDLQTQVRN